MTITRLQYEADLREAKANALREEAERIRTSPSLDARTQHLFSERLRNRAEWVEENG